MGSTTVTAKMRPTLARMAGHDSVHGPGVGQICQHVRQETRILPLDTAHSMALGCLRPRNPRCLDVHSLQDRWQVGSAWKASRRHYLRVLEVGHSRIKRALMAQTVMKAASAGTVYTDFMHVYPDPGTPNLRGDRENGENCFWESLFGRVFINRTAHLSNTNQNMGISTTTGTPCQ